MPLPAPERPCMPRSLTGYISASLNNSRSTHVLGALQVYHCTSTRVQESRERQVLYLIELL